MASFLDILREPDLIRAFGPDGEVSLSKADAGIWEQTGLTLSCRVLPDRLAIKLASDGVVSRIQLRWHGDLRRVQRYCGDHWERSYGDMAWCGESAGRAMPWYFLANDGQRTHAYGVRTGAGALCFWNADAQGISLWIDVRSGGVPVESKGRVIDLAEVVCREGRDDESAFTAAQSFCRQMSSGRRAVEAPVYGTNDWNYAYGQNSAELIAQVSGLVGDLSPNADNRPYSVIDEGWAMGPYENRFGHGPWVGNPRFGDMGAFADRLKSLGVRPGIWFRPLTPLDGMPDEWRLEREPIYLDPTRPEVIDHVQSHIRRFVEWGYEMIKHDFTTADLLGRWGFQMGSSPTPDGWRLADNSRTNAEVICDLYLAIRDAAGDAKLIGCNTIGHLSVGIHEIQRTGDDTSGRSWNRNRRMGVNTLAFRAPQHRAFFEVDPDIVAVTHNVPWRLVEQWLRLVSESGTALFVAIEPDAINDVNRAALSKALALAAETQPTAEPLDWMDTDCPRLWRLRGHETEFQWMDDDGAWPFGD